MVFAFLCLTYSLSITPSRFMLLLSCLTCIRLRPHGQQPTRLLCPQDSLGKNTGVGCHFLLHIQAYVCIIPIFTIFFNPSRGTPCSKSCSFPLTFSSEFIPSMYIYICLTLCKGCIVFHLKAIPKCV